VSVATERRYLDDERLPAPDRLLARSAGENFPVASRLLPRRYRLDLLAVYGFARLVDYVGDELPPHDETRLAALDRIETQLDQPSHPLIVGAMATVRSRGLDDALLRRLIEANRQDQRVHRYETFEQLLGYCELSANPVGRLVLGIFGASTPDREKWSDLICTGLQLTEHWQDVAEDAAVGRIYLPLEDLARFGVAAEQVTSRASGGVSSQAMRGLMAFEVARARHLLDQGTPLVGSMSGRTRVAVAGFVAGGQAALDGIAAADFDVLDVPGVCARPARHRRLAFARRFLGVLSQRNHRGPG